MSNDKDEVLAYYQQVLQDIRDTKARPWNFIMSLVAITGAVLALDEEVFKNARVPLSIGIASAAVATMIINIHSHCLLREKRNDPILKDKLPVFWGARDRRPWGDYMFLTLGMIVPVLSIFLLMCRLYRIPMCTCFL